MQKLKMNKPKKFQLLIVVILTVILSSCTNKKKETPVDTPQTENTSFNKILNFKNISFEIKVTGKKLTIQPTGLTIDNSLVQHEIEGTVLNAEIGDLNIDGFPEVLVYFQSVGSGSYGLVIAYSVNNGKSMSRIYFPEIAENKNVNVGYMGHDGFAIEENGLIQRFPIYKPGDINAKPTGGTRRIEYKLIDGETSRQFIVDKVVDY